MKESLETAYAEFASIAEGSWTGKVKEIAVRDLYDALGDDSEAFDNMVYERLGMSVEDVLDMLEKGDVLP